MKRRIVAALGLVLVAAAVAAPPRLVRAQANGGNGVAPGSAFADDIAVQAREAFRLKDKAALGTLRQAAIAQAHPLAAWVEYWELNNRLGEAQQGDFDAFAERWRGSYVEDRLRNDWLLELGRRRDWTNLRTEFPRFRMNDDREVTCYALLAAHLARQQEQRAAQQLQPQLPAGGPLHPSRRELHAAELAAWLAQRESDDGCQLLGATLAGEHAFTAAELWLGVRAAVEANRPRLARERAALIDANAAAGVEAAFKDPARLLAELRRGGRGSSASAQALAVVALWRLAAADPDAAAAQIEQHEGARLHPLELARAWGGVARQAALKQHPKAADFGRRAFAAWDKAVARSRPAATVSDIDPTGAAAPPPPPRRPHEVAFSDEVLAWTARAALRGGNGTPDRIRWALVLRSIEEMSAAAQRDATWVYWRARAIRAGAAPGPEGEGARALARMTLESIAAPLGFYAQLALEDLGRRVHLPAPPVPLVEAEREPLRRHAGLARSQRLMALGLRAEGVREWNYSLRGMNDRELLAAAALACEREIWDRCINTSERTRDVADITQRYPLPFREAVLARAGDTGVDPSYVYGLIRQESRFILDARSGVGASGLMQLMPATARWTARRAGLVGWKPESVNERDINLLLGTTYLKLVTEEFGGAQALGAAAYNAGPARPRRWREGAVVEPAAWVEGIPLNETRDYVKRVLSNAVIYSLRLRSLGLAGAPAAAAGPPTMGAGASSAALATGSAPASAASANSAALAVAPEAASAGTSGAAPGAGLAPASGGAAAAALVGPGSLRARLGGPIGPRDPAAPAENRDLP